MLNLLQKIAEHILGHKYYIVTVRRINSGELNDQRSMSNYIFRSAEDARAYFYALKDNKTFESIEIISFRSRVEYQPLDNYWKL